MNMDKLQADQQPQAPQVRSAAQKAWTAMMLACLVLTIVYGAISIIAYWPPYSWLADLQMGIFGGHIPILTYVAAMAVLVLPLSLAASCATRVLRRWMASRGIMWVSAPVSLAGSAKTDALTEGAADALAAFGLAGSRIWVKGWSNYAVLVAVGLGFVGYGLYKTATALDIGGIVHLSAADYYSASPPKATYVSVAGRAMWDAAVEFSEGTVGSSGRTDHYVPLAPPGDAAPDRPALFLKISKYDLKKGIPDPPFAGIVEFNDLPGEVHSEFRDGGLTPAATYAVLDLGGTPGSARASGWIAAIIGGAFTLMGLIRWAWRARSGGEPDQREGSKTAV